MHVPDHFVLPEDQIDAILSKPFFASLVTMHDDGPQATPVPFFFDRSRHVLVTHLARINPQAYTPITGWGLVLIDRGNAYVSPRWYATNEAMPNVPTWDYVAVHIRGPVRIDPSAEAALEAATVLTSLYEDEEVLNRVGHDRLTKMAHAIVAVEVEVREVFAKAKMSQNRHPDDVRALIARFEQEGAEDLADIMRDVSLPYACARFETIASVRSAKERRDARAKDT